MPVSSGSVQAVAQAVAALEVHVRGLDGRCSCGARGACGVYERASAVLAEGGVLPRRRPDAARRDLLRRMGCRLDGTAVAAA